MKYTIKNGTTTTKIIGNNIIKAKSLEEKKGIIITKKGFSKLLKASFKMEEKKRRKDKKWVMLIFDIPKYHQKSRNYYEVF